MAQEMQPNKALSGAEYAEIILKDVRKMLESDGMLAAHIAYRDVAHSISIKIMTNNPIIPNWTNKIKSLKSTPQQIEQDEKLESIKSFPLAQTAEDEPANTGLERTRKIVSPNRSRIENGLPVTISHRDPVDGDMKETKVFYEPDMVDEATDVFNDEVKDRVLTEGEITNPGE